MPAGRKGGWVGGEAGRIDEGIVAGRIFRGSLTLEPELFHLCVTQDDVQIWCER